LRIISGKHRARRINPPENLPVRPTTDMAKEALFNVLYNHFDFDTCDVLDLFSGTGNISYEFYSRACLSITAVEQNPQCIRFIESTKQLLKMDNFKVFQANCFQFLESQSAKYDIIFADPPYDLPEYERIVELVFSKELLKPKGMLVVEHSKHTKLNHLPHHVETRNYGSVHFSFFSNES